MGIRPGIRLKNEGGEIEFGILINDNGRISKEVEEFIAYIRNQLLKL